MSARLPVLSSVPPGRYAPGAAAPPCGACGLQATCWGHPRVDLRALNLLVCRFERGIERDRTFRAILSALTPVLAKLSRWTAKRARLPYDEVFGHLSTEVYLGLEAYLLGDAMGLVRWLFGPGRGCVWRAAEHLVHERTSSREMSLNMDDDGRHGEAASRRGTRTDGLEGRLLLLNQAATGGRIHSPPEAASGTAFVESTAADTTTASAAVAAALAVVDDGVTLTLGEYRVISFAMTWAREGGRPVEGLFAYLAKRWGVAKQNVQDQYTSAAAKLIRATGMQAHVLRTRGFTVRPVGAAAAPAGATVAQIALALGCSSRVVYKHRARARAHASAGTAPAAVHHRHVPGLEVAVLAYMASDEREARGAKP